MSAARPYPCPVCPRGYATEANLARHVRTNHARVPEKAARGALGSFDASKVETRKCAGACGLRLPVKKFPTVTGTPMRVAECRSCRDARTRGAKEATA